MVQWLVMTRQILSENGNSLSLQYFLLKKCALLGKETYGVMIQEQNRGEKGIVPNLSSSAVQVFRIVRQLADCTVTPTTLMDVLTDWEGTL